MQTPLQLPVTSPYNRFPGSVPSRSMVVLVKHARRTDINSRMVFGRTLVGLILISSRTDIEPVHSKLDPVSTESG